MDPALIDGTHDVFVTWRVLNIILGVIVFVALYRVNRRLKGGFSNAGRTFVNGHLFLVGTMVWISVESVLKNAPITPKSPLITMGLGLTLISLIRQKHDNDETGRLRSPSESLN